MTQDSAEAWANTAAVPEPPWRTARKPSARTPRTREAIVEAALRVLDADGIDGLSMRRVGEELGTGAASIYWHVRNKEQLLQLVFERVTEEAKLPEPDPSRWQEQLRAFAHRMREVLNNHRDVARLSIGRLPAGPTLAVYSEWPVAPLKPVGIPDQVIGYLGDLFGLYVGAYAFEESLGTSSFTGGDLSPPPIFGMLQEHLLSLPEEPVPHTRRAADLRLLAGPDGRLPLGVAPPPRALATYASKPPD